MTLQNKPPEQAGIGRPGGYDPLVPTTVTGAMRLLLLDVSRGSSRYVSGTVSAGRALALSAKFHERYDLSGDPVRRSRRRAKGEAVFALHFFPRYGATDLNWWLLRTDGDHPLLGLESWRDATNVRDAICWWDRYELVREPVPVAHRRKLAGPGGKPVKPVTWTWRFRREAIEAIRAHIRHIVQHPDDRLRQLARSLSAAPGWRQIRSDVKQLHRYLDHQQAQHRVPEARRVAMPATIRWTTPRTIRRVPLSVLCRRAAQGQESWFPDNDWATGRPPEADFPPPNTV
ncbi:MAG: hypothetical protein OSA97_10755 [Nevskia sp.]|nr:hypothetical protein [Nevskia sp.]